MKYSKIPGPYKRRVEPGPGHNTFVIGDWFLPEFEILANLPWEWTEKVNGTNVRVMWDGYKVHFGGRTDGANMFPKLIEELNSLFPEEIMEQVFGAAPVTLFGEGYGSGVVNGSGIYRPAPGFVLFDVHIGGFWLERANIEDVANNLGGIDVVPVFMTDNVHAAIKAVSLGLESQWGSFLVEGLVGKAPAGLISRKGERIMMKIKTKDFR